MGVPSPKEGRKEGGERREGGREASRIPPGSAVGAAGAEAAAAPPSPSSSSSSPSSPLRTPGPPARRRGGRCGGGRSRAPRCPESSMVREGGMARPPYSSAQDIQMDVFDNAALQVTPRGGGEGVRESPGEGGKLHGTPHPPHPLPPRPTSGGSVPSPPRIHTAPPNQSRQREVGVQPPSFSFGEGGSAPLYCITSPRLCPPPPTAAPQIQGWVHSAGGTGKLLGMGQTVQRWCVVSATPPPK